MTQKMKRVPLKAQWPDTTREEFEAMKQELERLRAEAREAKHKKEQWPNDESEGSIDWSFDKLKAVLGQMLISSFLTGGTHSFNSALHVAMNAVIEWTEAHYRRREQAQKGR